MKINLNEVTQSNQIFLTLYDIELTFKTDYEKLLRSFITLDQGKKIQINSRLTQNLINNIKKEIRRFATVINFIETNENYDLTDSDLLYQINQSKSFLAHLLELARNHNIGI